MANSLLTHNSPATAPSPDKGTPMTKDTRCWGYTANASAPAGYDAKIFASEEERTKAGWLDSPAKIGQVAAKPTSPFLKGKKPPPPDDDVDI